MSLRSKSRKYLANQTSICSCHKRLSASSRLLTPKRERPRFTLHQSYTCLPFCVCRAPGREGLARGVAERGDQLADLAAALDDGFRKLFERVPVVAGPLGRELAGDLADGGGVEVLHAREPWIERLPAAHVLIDLVA